MLHRSFLNRLPASCVTLRDNTERPETITVGTNELIGTDPSKLSPALARLDGRAVERRGDSSEMGRQGFEPDCGTYGRNIGKKCRGPQRYYLNEQRV